MRSLEKFWEYSTTRRRRRGIFSEPRMLLFYGRAGSRLVANVKSIDSTLAFVVRFSHSAIDVLVEVEGTVT